MARPKKSRRICSFPDYFKFRPEGECSDDVVSLSFDELEAAKLVDFQGLSQEDAAIRMEVSRPTVTQLCNEARKKILDAIINGKSLEISGGSVHLCNGQGCTCPGCHCHRNILKITLKEGKNTMRIAIPFENDTICQHFGRAPEFRFFDVNEGQITNVQTTPTGGSGHSAIAAFLAANETDVVICGGIGGGARMALASLGIVLIPGVSGNPEDSVKRLLAGEAISGEAEGCGCGCGGHHHEEAAGCCGGHHHHEEEAGCGCGCGGHSHQHHGGGCCCSEEEPQTENKGGCGCGCH